MYILGFTQKNPTKNNIIDKRIIIINIIEPINTKLLNSLSYIVFKK